jgi:hypothetical protein
VLVGAPSNTLDDETTTFPNSFWFTIPDEENMLKTLRPIRRTVGAHCLSILEVEEASSNSVVEAIANFDHFPLC